jgi:hypothetical protein
MKSITRSIEDQMRYRQYDREDAVSFPSDE